MTTLSTEPAPPGAAGSASEDKNPPSGQHIPLALHLGVVVAYAVLTLLLTYPIVRDISTQVPGGGDAWQHIWNLWWVKQALLVEHTNPYHTDMVYYPGGANLYFHTLVLTAGLTGIPLQLAGLNLLATYNLVLLSTFVLAGYAAFLLCHYLTRNAWASFVGGFVFAFAPYHFAHLFGHMNLASLQWIPFYVLLLIRALDTSVSAEQAPGRPFWSLRALPYAGGAGALLAVNAYTDWLYAIFLVLLTAMIVGWRLLAPTERARIRGHWAAFFITLALAGAVSVVLVSPVLFPTLEEARQGYAQQAPLETLVYSSDLASAFTPSELHPIWGKAIAAKLEATGPYLPMKNPSERDVFLGFTVIALAIYGFWRRRSEGAVRFWGFAAVLTWVLSLGPVLQVIGKSHFTAFDVTVPLPYLILYKLPLLSIMRTPARLTVLTMLALAILVAFGLASELPVRLNVRSLVGRKAVRPAFFGIALPLLIAFEYLALPVPMVPPGWGVPIYQKIAAEPGRFALLELPLRPFGDYMAYQTVHGKPIIGGYLSRQPPYPLLDQVPALKYLTDPISPTDPLQQQITGGTGVKELRELNVKYAIVRWWAFTPEQKAAMQAKLSALFGRPPDFSYPADQVDAWQLFP